MIKNIVFCNKQGQIRLLKSYMRCHNGKENKLHKEMIHACLKRSNKQCTFFKHGNDTVVYRVYGSLYFILLAEASENELALIEFLHNVVETFDTYFQKVCELDVIFHLDRVHIILDEMIQNGCIVESSKARILAPIYAMDQAL